MQPDDLTFGAFRIAPLRKWATEAGLARDVDLVLDATILVDRPDAVGSLLQILASPFARQVYQSWASTSPHALSLARISTALHPIPDQLFEYRPAGVHRKASTYFSGQLAARYLAALLVAQRPPPSQFATPVVRETFDFLRAWILYRAVRLFDETGIRHERNLHNLCERLRIATDSGDIYQVDAIGRLHIGGQWRSRPDRSERMLVQFARSELSDAQTAQARDLFQAVIGVIDSLPREFQPDTLQLPSVIGSPTPPRSTEPSR